MHDSLESLCAVLEALGAAVVAGKPDTATFQATWGWNCPPLNSAQIADSALQIAAHIRQASVSKLEPQQSDKINQCVAAVSAIHAGTLPYFFNGNVASAYPLYVSVLGFVEAAIDPIINPSVIQAKQITQVARKLEGLTVSIDNAIADEKQLNTKIDLINKATSAAEDLPITLRELGKAQENAEKAFGSASEIIGRIGNFRDEAETIVGNIAEKAVEAEKYASQCSEAARITTSVGLAAAFEARADELKSSVKMWVVGLVSALVAGGLVGYWRFQILTTVIQSPSSVPGALWVELLLSIASVGLPLWFAWLSTAQIGERFRLAEDYGFKSSVAKAYEGYRREAARFNPAIEERLFAAALSHLEEEPLRYVKTHASSSPITESGLTDTIKESVRDVLEAVSKKAKDAVTGS
jgi:hypothetical protein